MRVEALIFAFSTLTALVESAPFIPHDGRLQRTRRRAVDYPLLPYGAPLVPEMQGAPKLRKRSVDYSVVPVDGGSSGSNHIETTTVVESMVRTIEPSPATQTVFVTEPASTLAPATKTLVRTKVVTHTHKSPGKTVTATEIQIETATEIVTSASRKLKLVPTATIEPKPKIFVSTITAAPVPTSTHHYDDGMWHTSYPETANIISATGTITAAPETTSTKYYDSGMWHPPYPKTLTKSVTTPMTTPQNSSAPALAKRDIALPVDADVAYPRSSNTYGYGSTGKRARGVGDNATPPPINDSTIGYADRNELVKRSTDDSSEQMEGSKPTRRRLRKNTKLRS